MSKRAPALFIGHGSPMNAIEDNAFSRSWDQLGRELEHPKAILSISAHWFTPGTRVSTVAINRTIYDMYGFPEELYRVRYDAPGAPELARQALTLLGNRAKADDSWGLDHGTWSVLRHLFPEADVPVFQVSVDAGATFAEHFALGQRLSSLREEGVMLFGSGNVVHHLGKVNWGMEGGYPWADEFDRTVRDWVLAGEPERVTDPMQVGQYARFSIPTPDHYAPLPAVLGSVGDERPVAVLNDARVMGSLSMTSYVFA